jgi:hypothetical protein
MERIGAMFTTLTGQLTGIGIAVCTFFIVVAGFLYMTSAGSSRQMESAKVCGIAAVGGLVIIFIANALATMISSAVGGGGGGVPADPGIQFVFSYLA